MSPLGWLFLGLLALLAFVLAVACWRQDLEIQRLTVARHARPRERAAADSAVPDGAAPADRRPAGSAPAPVPDSLEWHAQTAAAEHANKMWRASEPYLPRRPKPGTLAARTVPVAHTDDAPPWEKSTGVQPAIDPEIDRMRGEYLRAYAAEHGGVTAEVLRDAMTGLRNLPAPSTAGPELAGRYLA